MPESGVSCQPVTLPFSTFFFRLTDNRLDLSASFSGDFSLKFLCKLQYKQKVKDEFRLAEGSAVNGSIRGCVCIRGQSGVQGTGGNKVGHK